MPSITNLGMLSIRLNRNSAPKSGAHWTNRRATSRRLTRRDFSVSSRASGAVTNTSEAMAVMPIAMAAMDMLRVRNSATLKIARTLTERSVWLMPAR